MDDDHAVVVRASGRRWRTSPTVSPRASRSWTRYQAIPKVDCPLPALMSKADERRDVWVAESGLLGSDALVVNAHRSSLAGS